MAWVAMNANHIIGPFFIDGAVTSAAYIEMLRTHFLPELQRRRIFYSCHFQQDRAPAHTARDT